MKRTYAVKEIATFLYSTGDLTNEFFQNHSQIDGKKAHLHLQRLYMMIHKKNIILSILLIIKMMK